MEINEGKARHFLQDLKELCETHKVQLVVNGYDGLDLFDLEDGEDYIHASSTNNKLFLENSQNEQKICQRTGFTLKEKKCHNELLRSYTSFIGLEIQHPDDLRDFADSMHRIQDLLAVRIVRRHYPKGWPIKKL